MTPNNRILHNIGIFYSNSNAYKKAQNTYKEALEIRRTLAKIVIKTRMNIPKAALLLELGWEPILDFINRQKVSYYKRALGLNINKPNLHYKKALNLNINKPNLLVV
jgi:tetratricopeptide (TPR) repeat protein